MPITIVSPGESIDLERVDPRDTGDLDSKREGEAIVERNVERIAALQRALYADGRHALLIVLQAMDAGGKDGTIRKVLSGVNPQGVHVKSFKVPTSRERRQDFLWRVHQHVPPRGMIGVFNRSHYEDVLVVRVHDLVPKKVWKKRYDAINAFERLLIRDANVTILKFFLHISFEEQTERMIARLENADKRWKFNAGDLEERKHWQAYRRAYEAMLERCSTEEAPWHVVPADKKWYRNVVVSGAILEALEGMDLRYPPDPEGWQQMCRELGGCRDEAQLD